MAKPTENLDWATNGTAQEIVEPTAGMRTEGIKSGGSWYRENLNWMFNGVGKWIDWLQNEVRSNTENDTRYVQHTDVVDDLNSTSTTNPLSAKQGKLLKGQIENTGQAVLSDLVPTSNSVNTFNVIFPVDFTYLNFLHTLRITMGLGTGLVVSSQAIFYRAGAGNALYSCADVSYGLDRVVMSYSPQTKTLNVAKLDKAGNISNFALGEFKVEGGWVTP